METYRFRLIHWLMLFFLGGGYICLFCEYALSQNVAQQEALPTRSVQELQRLLHLQRFEGGEIPVFTEEEFQRLLQHQEQFQKKIVPQETKGYVENLLQKSLAHREQIKSGQMVIAEHLKLGGHVTGEVTREITIAFDEQRRRVDRHNAFPNQDNYDEVGCIGCCNKDNRLILGYNNRQRGKEEFSQTSIHIYDETQYKENELTKSWTQNFGLLPQYIACFRIVALPTKETFERGKGSLLVNTISIMDSGVTEVTIMDEDYKGTKCKKIIVEANWTDGRVTRNTLWIAEEQGHSLRKHYYQSAANYDELLDVDVALDEESGIWFPSA